MLSSQVKKCYDEKVFWLVLSETGSFALLSAIGHGPDTVVHLFHGVHNVEEPSGTSLLVSESLQSFDYTLDKKRTRLELTVDHHLSKMGHKHWSHCSHR